MTTRYSLVTASLLSLTLAGCAGSNKAQNANKIPALREIYKKDFAIGTALNNRQVAERDTAAARLVPQQFDAATPENMMKAALLHPEWNRYTFEEADKLVAYAQKHHIKVNAHTLIWHSQLPAFMRHMNSADSVRQFMHDHITTVAGRYDGQVYSWDVVNEALNEDGTMRKSVFQQKLGDDFVVEAFRLAQQAAPHTHLYYNDYNIEQPAKRAGAIALIKKIQAAGVRIDGVGIQGHWSIENLPLREIEKSIQEFGELGIEVMFTELDLSVLPNPRGIVGADVSQSATYNDKINPYRNGLPDSMQTKLADSYESLFKLFLQYKNKVSRVTFWGVDDGQSWLNDFPVRGRTNYPLLFDRKFQPKPAFYRVIDIKKQTAHY